MRIIGYPAAQAHGRLILGELQDNLEAARDCPDPHAATDYLRDAEFHRRRFDRWAETNVQWGDDLDAWAYLAFAHGDVERRQGDAISDAISDYRGTRRERIDGMLADVRTLQRYLAASARAAQQACRLALT
ncbi:hypothetical protein [Methylobacterium sp. J-068]|uniref:hypothetical protein n=1 Tax=Methylobacterium sp. J-068 TaxID=2836649 RepID=UPI001FBA7F2F|nr:hypothetical protein [Methylobacterium sp. J-068]MCJ2036463.1 hypothetical protein [Methylobacterium sp. J-068]